MVLQPRKFAAGSVGSHEPAGVHPALQDGAAVPVLRLAAAVLLPLGCRAAPAAQRRSRDSLRQLVWERAAHAWIIARPIAMAGPSASAHAATFAAAAASSDETVCAAIHPFAGGGGGP